ncbi:MAG: Methyltransferase type 12, partial [Pseudonocardia sp.]|nr:Methyltransferase type 12 [Pseudonocardia sp.]
MAVNSSPRSRDFDPEPGGPVTTASPPAEAAGSLGGASSPGVLGSAPDHRYLLDTAQAEAGERFVALAELFDGVTRGHFDRLGVGPGWRCWEVGAGG